MAYLAEILGNGLHNACLYAVLAYSYVLLHQVLPKPNLAHGAFFALGGQLLVMGANLAYNGLIFTLASSLAFGAASLLLLGSLVVAVFASVVVPRFVDRSPNMLIVTTLALAIVLMEAVRIGSEGRDFWLPPLTTQTFALGFGVSLTVVQLFNIAVLASLLTLADFVLSATGAGRAIRAVAQQPATAALCGVNTQRVIVLTAAASAVMACFGGMLAVLHFGNMSFGAGLTYGLKVLFIAAAGGFSTPRMAAVAAFAYGEAESLWDGYMPILWRDAFFFAALAGLLVVRGREQR
jgi:branched-chain amino acid transport system permease protein